MNGCELRAGRLLPSSETFVTPKLRGEAAATMAAAMVETPACTCTAGAMVLQMRCMSLVPTLVDVLALLLDEVAASVAAPNPALAEVPKPRPQQNGVRVAVEASIHSPC